MQTKLQHCSTSSDTRQSGYDNSTLRSMFAAMKVKPLDKSAEVVYALAQFSAAVSSSKGSLGFIRTSTQIAVRMISDTQNSQVENNKGELVQAVSGVMP
jgi:hypothetical protein